MDTQRSPAPLPAAPAADVAADSRFVVVMLMTLKPDGAAGLASFRAQAAPLFQDHDLRIERQLDVRAKGQIVGENPFALPDMIQVLSFPSAERFKAYLADPRYQALAPLRDAALASMTVLAGQDLDISPISTPGLGPVASRLYGVGLVRFKPAGEAGLDTFNARAQALFKRHGMHVERMVRVQHCAQPVGEKDDRMAPERVVIFFLDDASAMRGYIADPEYLALAPLRDKGLARYDFFVGTSSC